jgi:hypothetical protein
VPRVEGHAGRREERVRAGPDLVVLLMVGGGVMFTLVSIAAWTRGRRLGAVVLAIVAGVDFAFAISLLTR